MLKGEMLNEAAFHLVVDESRSFFNCKLLKHLSFAQIYILPTSITPKIDDSLTECSV